MPRAGGGPQQLLLGCFQHAESRLQQGAWLLPGLELLSPLSLLPNHLVKGLPLNLRGLWPLTALKLKDAGGVKMLLLLLVWQWESSEIRANSNKQPYAVHTLIYQLSEAAEGLVFAN